MFGKGKYSHSRYRGRRGGNTALKVLVAVLAVLLVVGVLLYFFWGKYIQYTDDGVRLNLPWTKESADEEADVPRVSEFVVEEEPASTFLPAVVTEEEPFFLLEGVEVTAEEILAGTAADTAKNAGGNALVVLVKDVDGNLAWQSDTELAKGAGLSGEAAFDEAIRRLDAAEELYLVARMNCFQDLWMCVYDKSMALTNENGGLWYDTYGMPWLSPANDRAREYLTQLCLELANLGFDEILLERGAFPPKGRLSSISVGTNYPAEGRDGLVEQWFEVLCEELADAGVRVSVYVTEAELSGESSNSGWTAAGLARADRVWLDAGADLPRAAETLQAAGMEAAEEHLVQVCAEVPEDRSGSWALLLS